MGKYSNLFYIMVVLFYAIHIYPMDIIVTSSKLDTLPLELHGQIVKQVFNCVIHKNIESKKDIDQKKLEQYILKIPIDLGIKFCNEFDYIQNLCKSKIGGKQFLARQLFVLPREQRDVFIRLANRSYVSIGDIDANDYKIIIQVTQEDIKKGLKLEVNYMNKKVVGIRLFGLFMFFGGGLMVRFVNHVSLNTVIFTSLGGAGLIGFSEILNLLNSNYRMNDDRWFLKKVKL